MSATSNPIRHSPVSSATKQLLVFSWLIVACCCVANVAMMKNELPLSKPVRAGVDPNAAPWWELTVLPEIGPSQARRIVDYRETLRAKNGATAPSAVFHTATDLDAVKGIGPKTITRLLPHLRFEGDKRLSDFPDAADNDRQPQKEQD